MTACTRVHTEDSFKIRSYVGESPIIYAVHTLQEQSTFSEEWSAFFISFKTRYYLLKGLFETYICVVGRRGIETTGLKTKYILGNKE